LRASRKALALSSAEADDLGAMAYPPSRGAAKIPAIVPKKRIVKI